MRPTAAQTSTPAVTRTRTKFDCSKAISHRYPKRKAVVIPAGKGRGPMLRIDVEPDARAIREVITDPAPKGVHPIESVCCVDVHDDAVPVGQSLQAETADDVH